MLTETIKNEKLPVVIFGTGGAGEATFYFLKEAGIKVDCFCDNSISKIGMELYNKEIISPEGAKDKYPDAVFIISSSEIKDVIGQLKSLGFYRFYLINLLLRNFDVYKHEYTIPTDFVDYSVSSALACQDNYLEPNKIFLRSVDVIITERCSLKCRDCSNLTQYYQNPKDCKTDRLLKEIDKFCELIDGVFEFRVLGGEPFMNKEFHIIADRLIKEPKAKRVVFYTNGTIVPNKEQLKSLKSDKVLIMISDYGKLSRNIDGLKRALKKNDITFYAPKITEWTNCSDIIKHNRSVGENKEIFKGCCMRNTTVLSNGRVYRCPFSANIGRLKAVDTSDNYSVDVFSVGAKEKIKEFMSADHIKICDYCNGRLFTSPKIEPAIQIEPEISCLEYVAPLLKEDNITMFDIIEKNERRNKKQIKEN